MTASPASVLIVEDEQIVALDLMQTVEDLGYTVAGTASTGAEALALARTAAPDVVLMDIHLDGDTDGVAAAQSLRKASGPPVVFVTAFDDPRTVLRAKLSEPYGYLLKPFNVRELRVAIELALHHHRVRSRRDALVQHLRAALSEVTRLPDMLRMCAYCRRVAGDTGEWQPFERYLLERAGTMVSHGMCPACVDRAMPGPLEGTDGS